VSFTFNPRVKFEVCIFSHSRDIRESQHLKSRSCDLDHAPFDPFFIFRFSIPYFHFACKIWGLHLHPFQRYWGGGGVLTLSCADEQIKKHRPLTFHPFVGVTPWTDRHAIWDTEWRPRRNDPCQILFQSVKEFLRCSTPKSAISYTFLDDTTVLHYRADRQKITAILFVSCISAWKAEKDIYLNKCNFSKTTKHFFVKFSAIISEVCRNSITLRWSLGNNRRNFVN